MLGAILGDVAGSPFEFDNYTQEDFELLSRFSFFTDDTVLTMATAHAILTDGDYGKAYHEYGNRYRDCSYGAMFRSWLGSPDPKPYWSLGNGAAMRVAPVGFAFSTLEETLAQAEASASPTHNHPEGIASARAIADAIFLLRTGKIAQKEVAGHLTRKYGYRIDLDLNRARENNRYSETAIACVPVAVTAFANSVSLEDCIRKAVSLGGDSDTIAAIAGGLAEACFGIPDELKQRLLTYLPDEFLSLIQAFYSRK